MHHLYQSFQQFFTIPVHFTSKSFKLTSSPFSLPDQHPIPHSSHPFFCSSMNETFVGFECFLLQQYSVEFKEMGALFDGFFRRQLITYNPQQWCKRLGEKCEKCYKNLTHQKCISLCTCYYFAHEECFKQAFQTQVYSEKTDIQCSQCQAFLQIQLNPHFNYNPLVTRWKILKLLVALVFLIVLILALMVTLNSDIKVQIAFLLLYLEGVLLSINLYALVICIRDIFYQKIVKIQEITSTKLDIQTSAFKDIEMETNEEITKDCLFTGQR